MDGSIEHHYDKEADVLYVSFADDEPAYTKNLDDIVLLEIGCFSGFPKGFRVLSPRTCNVDIVHFIMKQIHGVVKNRLKTLKKAESMVNGHLKEELPELLTTHQA